MDVEAKKKINDLIKLINNQLVKRELDMDTKDEFRDMEKEINEKKEQAYQQIEETIETFLLTL